jgi:hypothetical protein
MTSDQLRIRILLSDVGQAQRLFFSDLWCPFFHMHWARWVRHPKGNTVGKSAMTSPLIQCRRKILSKNADPWADNRFGTSQKKQELWPRDHDVPYWLDAEIYEEQQSAWSVVHGVQLCLPQRAVLGAFDTNIPVCIPSFYGLFPSTAGMHKSRVRGHTID